MYVTVTERGSFMRCRTAWDWGSYNRKALQPIIVKPALRIGHLWHETQAKWSLHPDQDPNEIALTLCAKEEERVKKDYLKNVGVPISPVEMDPVYDGITLVRSMVNNYHKRWGTPLPDGFEMVSPEQTCVIPIPDTEHDCESCDGVGWIENMIEGEDGSECPSCAGEGQIPHYLTGTLDGLIKSSDGRLYILERKTYGNRPKLEVLNMSDQFLAYLWLLRALNIGEVGGLAYDGAWKRKEPPRGATLEDLFLRTLLRRNRVELDRFTGHLRAQVLDMANNPIIYPNRRWEGCWDCQFVEPCIAQEKGEDVDYILRTKYVKRPPSERTTEGIEEAA